MRQKGLAIVAGLLAAAAPLAAQEKGTIEVGGFGRYTGYPDSYQVQGGDGNRVGSGGRLGVFIARNFALELDGSFNPTDLKPNQPAIPSTTNAISRPINYIPFHLRGIYNIPMGNSAAFMLGAGGTYTQLKKGIDDSYMGVAALAGVRLKPTSWLNLRFEGTADYLPSGFNDESDTYLGAQAGLSFLIGGKGCDKSTDMIGIRPTSATVAPNGTQQFSADATHCGNPDQVTYSLSGPGSIDPATGLYTAGSTEGCGTVTARSAKGKLMSSANVCVRAPAPPPPPPPPPAPAPAPPPPPQRPAYTFQLQMVHFEFDKSSLTTGARDTLNNVANTLKANPDVRVDVVGHTDWVGTNAYNMRLSEARALTVKNYLVAQGVAADRITIRWRGEEEPAADNNTAAGRATNRRAEIKQNN